MIDKTWFPVNELSITESLYVLANNLLCITNRRVERKHILLYINKQSIKKRKRMAILNIEHELSGLVIYK